jgi:hypothetical protein
MGADCQAARGHGQRPLPRDGPLGERAGLELLPFGPEHRAAADRQVIAVMRQRLAAGEEVARMYQGPGLAWLERQADVAEDLVAAEANGKEPPRIMTAWVGDSNSTATVSSVRGQGAVGPVTCGFCEPLLTAGARRCPSLPVGCGPSTDQGQGLADLPHAALDVVRSSSLAARRASRARGAPRPSATGLRCRRRDDRRPGWDRVDAPARRAERRPGGPARAHHLTGARTTRRRWRRR